MIQQELCEDLHSLTVLLRWSCGQRKKTWAPWFTVTLTGWCESLGGSLVPVVGRLSKEPSRLHLVKAKGRAGGVVLWWVVAFWI